MHEMSIAMSLLELAKAEAEKQRRKRIISLRVEYGAISGIMPDALDFCFKALVAGTIHENANLELVCLPLRLKCPLCGHVFGGEGKEALWEPCPKCGEFFGHIVEQGKELILARLEAGLD